MANNKQNSKKEAPKASTILKDDKSSANSKSAAGSTSTQTKKTGKK